VPSTLLSLGIFLRQCVGGTLNSLLQNRTTMVHNINIMNCYIAIGHALIILWHLRSADGVVLKFKLRLNKGSLVAM